MLLDGFKAAMEADGGVSGFVDGAHITKSVLARDYNFPAVVIHRYAGSLEYECAGPIGTREDKVQVDCYANDADTCELLSAAVRGLFAHFVGTLPDGTVVQACYLENDMDSPWVPTANTLGIGFRALLTFRVVSAA